MSTEPFIGEIKILGFNFPPRGYTLCSGQLISIAENTALFSLIGTNYGGDGQVTFGLPDLQGRAPIGQGQGPGLPDYVIGQKGGNTQTTITVANMPAHSHPAQGITVNMPVSNNNGDVSDPSGAYLAKGSSDIYSSVATSNSYGALTVAGQTGITGSNTPIDITNPYLAINYSIALEGIFPSRN
jgi:microcystin-dependent protein